MVQSVTPLNNGPKKHITITTLKLLSLWEKCQHIASSPLIGSGSSVYRTCRITEQKHTRAVGLLLTTLSRVVWYMLSTRDFPSLDTCTVALLKHSLTNSPVVSCLISSRPLSWTKMNRQISHSVNAVGTSSKDTALTWGAMFNTAWMSGNDWGVMRRQKLERSLATRGDPSTDNMWLCDGSGPLSSNASITTTILPVSPVDTWDNGARTKLFPLLNDIRSSHERAVVCKYASQCTSKCRVMVRKITGNGCEHLFFTTFRLSVACEAKARP